MEKSNVLWLVLSKNKQQQLSKILKLTWILCVCFVFSVCKRDVAAESEHESWEDVN